MIEEVAKTAERSKDEQKEERDKWNKEIEWMVEEKERERRRRNLVISGIEGEERQEKSEMEKWIKDNLNIETRIERVWKIRTDSKTRLIGIQCREEKDREEILKNKKRLGDKKVFIEEDLTWKERRNKEIVRRKAREIKGQGKEAIIIRNRKVKTEEGTWTWSEKKEMWFLNKDQKLQ